MSFKSFDLRDAAIEAIQENDELQSLHLLSLLDMSVLELIEKWASENDCIDSEEALSAGFDEEIMPMILEQHGKPGVEFSDQARVNECFNDWTDALRSYDEIHELQYNQYSYVGKYCE